MSRASRSRRFVLYRIVSYHETPCGSSTNALSSVSSLGRGLAFARSLARSITRVCPRRVVHSARSRLSFASLPYRRVLTGAAVPAHSTHNHGHGIPTCARARSLVLTHTLDSRIRVPLPPRRAAPRRAADVTQPPLLCPLSSRLVSRSRARSSALGGGEPSRAGRRR